MKQTFTLAHILARRNAVRAVEAAPNGHVVTITEPKRNLEQNALMWVILTAFGEQVEWPVNGCMTKLDAEDWKHVLSAAFRREHMRLAQGLDGGVVMLGLRTSRMSKAEMGEFLEFLTFTAAERGVKLEPVAKEDEAANYAKPTAADYKTASGA